MRIEAVAAVFLSAASSAPRSEVALIHELAQTQICGDVRAVNPFDRSLLQSLWAEPAMQLSWESGPEQGPHIAKVVHGSLERRDRCGIGSREAPQRANVALALTDS